MEADFVEPAFADSGDAVPNAIAPDLTPEGPDPEELPQKEPAPEEPSQDESFDCESDSADFPAEPGSENQIDPALPKEEKPDEID